MVGHSGLTGKKRGRPPAPHQFVNGVETKLCRPCGLWTPLSEFGSKPRSGDGLTSQCKACMSKAGKGWRQRRAASPPIFPLDTLKTCTQCQAAKPITAFRKQATGAFGRQAACKACSDVYNDTWRARRRPERLAYNRAYYSSDRGAQVRSEYVERKPAVKRAQQMMWAAIQAGRLVKSTTCEDCDSSGRISGHHDDYAKPLSVRWLCDKCHKGWHRIHGEAANAQMHSAVL